MHKKNILLFWFGKQGRKYYSHYIHAWCHVSVVNTDGIQKYDIILPALFSIRDIYLHREKLYTYDMIIVAVLPIWEQEKIISFLLEIPLTCPIILEKPISHNRSLLIKTQALNNYYYYVDEFSLCQQYEKILQRKFSQIRFIITTNTYDRDILEHALWPFLLQEDFSTLLQQLVISLWDKDESEMLEYTIWFDDTYCVKCKKGVFYLNDKTFYSLSLEKSIDSILQLTPEQNKIYKTNFGKIHNFFIL